MSGMNEVLRVESLSVQTRGSAPKTLVNPLSFELTQGKAVNLVGETGSGKSLIAQAIFGNIADDLEVDGNIWIDGIEYGALPKSKRKKLWGRKIGLLPQEPWLSLNPTKKSIFQLSEVYEKILKRSKRQSIEFARKDLGRLNIEDAKEKYPYQLSGGMAQRLVFCCTLAGGTEVLIVDEPTKGLDSDRRFEVIKQLQEFLKSGGYLLVITHDIEVAEKLGGETFVMKDGVVQESNQTDQLLTSPSAPYTQALIGAAPIRWPEREKSKNGQVTVITAKNISKRFNGTDLFSNATLEIHRGEIVGLFGPSGSGKSTLGNIMLGLMKKDSGEVQKTSGFADHQFLKLYQDPPATFSPYHSLESSLNDFLHLHQIDSFRFEDMLSKLNLDHETLLRQPGNISGGELQRCSILRALLLDPVFLFADEPTSRLDPLTQKETVDLICSTTRRTNCGVLLVSHDYELLLKSCDRIVTMNDFQQ